jgi:hypothetical protein
MTESRPGEEMTVPGSPSASQGVFGDDARWQEAARLRREHRAWIIIWLATENCFRAYRRLPGARRDTALSAATSAQMAGLIGPAEQAAAARPGRRGSGTR